MEYFDRLPHADLPHLLDGNQTVHHISKHNHANYDEVQGDISALPFQAVGERHQKQMLNGPSQRL
jgi:hypothetical protein